MLSHPDRPFRDAHARHAERTTAAARRPRRRTPERPIRSADERTDLLASLRRIAAAFS